MVHGVPYNHEFIYSGQNVLISKPDVGRLDITYGGCTYHLTNSGFVDIPENKIEEIARKLVDASSGNKKEELWGDVNLLTGRINIREEDRIGSPASMVVTLTNPFGS